MSLETSLSKDPYACLKEPNQDRGAGNSTKSWKGILKSKSFTGWNCEILEWGQWQGQAGDFFKH